jgi:hypothetical protein
MDDRYKDNYGYLGRHLAQWYLVNVLGRAQSAPADPDLITTSGLIDGFTAFIQSHPDSRLCESARLTIELVRMIDVLIGDRENQEAARQLANWVCAEDRRLARAQAYWLQAMAATLLFRLKRYEDAAAAVDFLIREDLGELSLLKPIRLGMLRLVICRDEVLSRLEPATMEAAITLAQGIRTERLREEIAGCLARHLEQRRHSDEPGA